MCSGIGCSRTFHRSCLASHGFVEGGEVDSDSHQIEFYCMECRCTIESSIKHVPWDSIQMQHSVHELEIIIQKGCCLGLLGPSDVNEPPMEVTKCSISMKNAISKCNSRTIIQPLLDNDPYSYPTPVQMFNKQTEKHVVYGR
jgi:hypothetical protein